MSFVPWLKIVMRQGDKRNQTGGKVSSSPWGNFFQSSVPSHGLGQDD